MKKITCYRVIMWTLVLITMTAIFLFSSQPSQESSQLSDKVYEVVENIISITTPSDTPPDITESQRDVIINFIRKSAHALIYTLLGFLLMGSFSLYEMKLSLRATCSSLIGVVYALSDEWHQTFVSGRSGEFRDVAIDFCGVISGIALMILLIALINRIKKHKASA